MKKRAIPPSNPKQDKDRVWFERNVSQRENELDKMLSELQELPRSETDSATNDVRSLMRTKELGLVFNTGRSRPLDAHLQD